MQEDCSNQEITGDKLTMHERMNINQRIIIREKLTDEIILAMFRGKEICIQTPEAEITLYPPVKGIFISEEDYRHLRYFASSDQKYIFSKIEENN